MTSPDFGERERRNCCSRSLSHYEPEWGVVTEFGVTQVEDQAVAERLARNTHGQVARWTDGEWVTQ